MIEELSGIQTGVIDPFAEAIAFHGGLDLLPHQAAAIDAAAVLVQNVPVK